MDHQAHGLSLNHPIFTVPNRVRFDWHEVPAPARHAGRTSALHPEGMGDTLRLTAFERDKQEWNPTLVNHEGFFTDVPGFENLAEGNSEKELGSLSLARQGKWFYWGYSIDPERTTDAAKDTLVNVLHYMRGKRHSQTVRFVCTPRQILRTYLELSRQSGYERGIEEHMVGQLVEAARATYTDRSLDGCAAWQRENLPYVFSGKGPEHTSKRYQTVFEVDADAKALGTPNAERASLERWIQLVSDPAAGDAEARTRARRCLLRYVHPSLTIGGPRLPGAAPGDPTAVDWREWYRTWRERIVFIESTGFWWQEDPRVVEREAAHALPR